MESYLKKRLRLIQEEIIPAGINNPKIITAFTLIPRHLFVSPKYHPEAYFDYPIPILNSLTTSQPSLIAYILQSLNLNSSQSVLEIGTGSGYQTALLSKLCQKVFTIEISPFLHQKAFNIFAKLKLDNIFSKLSDGKLGWPENAPFDAIIVSAASEKIPTNLISQLKIGGKIIIPLGTGNQDQILTMGTKSKNQFISKTLKPVRFVPLK